MKPTEILDAIKGFMFGKSESTAEEPASSYNDAPFSDDGTPCAPAIPPMDSRDILAHIGDCFQIGLKDFTFDRECIGFYLDPENRWVKLANEVFIPEMEEVYSKRLLQLRDVTRGQELSNRLRQLEQKGEAAAFWEQMELPFIDKEVQAAMSDTGKAGNHDEASAAGRRPFSFRQAFGVLVIQALLDLSDRGTCKIVSESPYLQYFLGYETFSVAHTMDPSNLVHFKKRFDAGTMQILNDIVIRNKSRARELMDGLGTPEPTANAQSQGTQAAGWEKACKEESVRHEKPKGNVGTLILDATCGPVNIRYPQDFSILNEARLGLEKIIEDICARYNIKKPRTYVLKLQAAFLKLAKSKRKQDEEIRHVLQLELNAIVRNLGYIEKFLREQGIKLTTDEIERIQVIRAVYAQQKYMFKNKIHRVADRIVSISMPFIRPIVRGKTNTPVEFGPKYDIAVDGNGFARITNFSFDSFNEAGHLVKAVENYRQNTGYYPERVLADQIYRTKDNLKFCKDHGIRLSGPCQGRKPKDEERLLERVANEKKDMVDRIEVERRFSRAKRCFGIECIVERTPENIGHAVGMSVFLDNIVPIGF